MSILVCGATGFIGRNVVEQFAAAGLGDIRAVWHSRPPYPIPGVTWHRADLRDPKAIERLMPGTTCLIQAAATTSGARDIVDTPYIHVTDNAVMNSLLLRSAFEHRVPRFVFFSCSVMYPPSTRPLVESDFDGSGPVHPRYFGAAWTKVYVEKMCEFYAGLGVTQFTVIRHSNVYGPHDKFDLHRSHVFGATISKVTHATSSVTIWGGGDEGRDLIHVDDLIRFVRLSLDLQRDRFGLYNVGLGEAVTVRHLVDLTIRASGKRLTVAHDFTKPTIPITVVLDCTRARQHLGWAPTISLEEGIERTMRWYISTQP